MSKRPLSTLSLPPATLSVLARGGYETVQDLSTLTPECLAKDLNISLPSSQAILSATQAARAPPMTQSAASIVGGAAQYTTHCRPLDSLLEGGLKRGYILELSGAPGCKKEALASDVASSFVEVSQGVLFVDMQNMTSPATLNKALRKSTTAAPDYKKLVHYLRLHTLPDLMIFLRNLPAYLQTHPEITLLVLNSLSFPFQSPIELHATARNAALDRVKHILTRACASSRLTVVITSQLATKFLKTDGSAANYDTGSKAVMVPQIRNAYLPTGRTYRVLIVPQSHSSGKLRLLSSPAHNQGRNDPREEDYNIVSLGLYFARPLDVTIHRSMV